MKKDTASSPVCDTCGTACADLCEGSCDGRCADGAVAGERLLHLPVAPRTNARGRYAPVADGEALSAQDALRFLAHALGKGAPVARVDLDGPGDPLATSELTLELVARIRELFPETSVSLTTNGLHGAASAGLLAQAGLGHLTITVDAVSASVAAQLYAWIRPNTKTLPIAKAAEILVAEQAAAIAACREAGLTVRVRTTVYPGVNHTHVGDIARTVAALGAQAMEIVGHNAPADADGPVMESAPASLLGALREQAGQYLPVLDAPGASDADACARGDGGKALLQAWRGQTATGMPIPSGDRPNVAVASSDGFEVNRHLGQAAQFLVYGREGGTRDGLVKLLGARQAPQPGSGDGRWEAVASLLADCAYLVAAGAGERPKTVLQEKGIRVIVAEGGIEGLVDVLYGGGKKGKGKGR
ncbi:MAG: NifB/NifX family molybdenum-iron cluster-binding protein [Desulfovibrionaceae bacterium]